MTQRRSAGEGLLDRLRPGNVIEELGLDRIASALQAVREEAEENFEPKGTTRTDRVVLSTSFRNVRHGLGREAVGAAALEGLPVGASLRVEPASSPTVFVRLALSSGGPARVKVQFR